MRQITGLEGRAGVQEYVAESPFSYEKNCLLYLPKTLENLLLKLVSVRFLDHASNWDTPDIKKVPIKAINVIKDGK